MKRNRDTFQAPNTPTLFSTPTGFTNLGNRLYLSILQLPVYKSEFLFPLCFSAGQDPYILHTEPDWDDYSSQRNPTKLTCLSHAKKKCRFQSQPGFNPTLHLWDLTQRHRIIQAGGDPGGLQSSLLPEVALIMEGLKPKPKGGRGCSTAASPHHRGCVRPGWEEVRGATEWVLMSIAVDTGWSQNYGLALVEQRINNNGGWCK